MYFVSLLICFSAFKRAISQNSKKNFKENVLKKIVCTKMLRDGSLHVHDCYLYKKEIYSQLTSYERPCSLFRN